MRCLQQSKGKWSAPVKKAPPAKAETHYRMVIDYDAEERVWVVNFPELLGCMAHGRDPVEAVKVGLEIKDDWLKTAAAKGYKIPSEPKMDIADLSGQLGCALIIMNFKLDLIIEMITTGKDPREK